MVWVSGNPKQELISFKGVFTPRGNGLRSRGDDTNKEMKEVRKNSGKRKRWLP